MENSVFGALEGLQWWTWLVDCRNRIASCKKDNWRLLEEDFESKSIKERVKFHFNNSNNQLIPIAYQFTITLISPNFYITQKLNNINKAKVFNEKYKDWTKHYHKIL